MLYAIHTLYLCLGLFQSLGHAVVVSIGVAYPGSKRDLQVKERELARATAVLVHKSTGQVAAKDGPQVVLRDLF